jgi:hypothetical protein
MRVISWFASILGAGLLGAFVACGSSVSQEAAAGGATGTTTSTHAATVATSSAGGGGQGGTGGMGGAGGSGGGAGGGNACQDACNKASSCGFNLCGMFNIDCADATPAMDCVAACIENDTCAQIETPATLACAMACNAQGTGGAGGGSVMGCTACAAQSCFGQAGACEGSPDCKAWLQCLQTCIVPTCAAECNQANPGAATLYDPVYACLCTSCSTPCSGVLDPCDQLPDGGMGGAGGAGGAGGGMEMDAGDGG